jgi:site-specific recombinase XerC
MNTLAAGEGPEAERDSALFNLMLASGIRLGSVVGLNVEDVNLDGGLLLIRTTKGNRPDQVFLSKRISQHLRKFIGDRTDGPLFLGRHGKRLSRRHVQRRFSQWLERAGIARGVSPHCLRHTFGMKIYRKSRDLLLTQIALGHKSVISTLTYARCDDDRLRQLLQA